MTKAKPPLELADRYIKKNYPDTKYNIVAETVNFGIEGIGFDDVFTELRMEGIKVTHHELETYFRSNKTKKYDPFREYFESLQYDGKTDFIQDLSRHVIAQDQEFFDTMFKKHLVRAVGQALGDGIFVNRFVLVLRSMKEHLGKSTLIRFLDPFGGDYYVEHLGNNEALALSKHLIWNIEELESLNKAGINKLKALISTSKQNDRVMYTQIFTTRVRRCSIFASTNETAFLEGGENSRWIIINVDDIDFSYHNTKSKKSKVSIDDVWAQAYYLLNNGYNYDLTADEWRKSKDFNKGYIYLNDIDLHVREKLVPSKDEFATATEIGEYFKLTLGKNFYANAIGVAMVKAGYENISKGKRKGYNVITMDNFSINDAILMKKSDFLKHGSPEYQDYMNSNFTKKEPETPEILPF